MDWEGLKRDWRMWVLVISLLISFGLIFNITDPYSTEDGKVVLNTNIKQGLDLQGGARVLIGLAPEDREPTDKDVRQTIDTLRTRISAFGLQDMSIREVRVGDERMIQIELAGANTSDLTELINRTGRFEARMPFTLEDGTGFDLGSERYTASLEDRVLEVDGNTVQVNDTFNLSTGSGTVQFEYVNYSEGRATVSGLAFTGQDMLDVDISAQTSGVQRTDQGWQFQFQVDVTREAAQRTTAIAQAMNKGPRDYLIDPVSQDNAKIVLTLDGSRVSALNIRNTFQDSPVQQPVITGGEDTREAAVTEMNQLKSVLESGALPVPIEVVQNTEVSATLGQEFLRTAIAAILIAIIAVAFVVYVRYRDLKIVVPLTLTGYSELVMIFGFAAAVGWTIDLPSIAGIIAAVGTGVDDQIIITDERGKRKLKSMKKRFKRAFFIIFTSAASTIGAMLPLTRIGAGAIQGFAVTTIAGVIIGVSITRPAYARVLQHMDR